MSFGKGRTICIVTTVICTTTLYSQCLGSTTAYVYLSLLTHTPAYSLVLSISISISQQRPHNFRLSLLLSPPHNKRQLRISKTTVRGKATPSPLSGASHLCSRSTTAVIEDPTYPEGDRDHCLTYLRTAASESEPFADSMPV